MKRYVVLYQETLGAKTWRRVEVSAANPQAALHAVLSPQYDDHDDYIEAEVYEQINKTIWTMIHSWQPVQETR